MKIAYTRQDGGMNIVNAAPKEQLEIKLGPLTDEQYREHVSKRSLPIDAIDVSELPDDWAPPDREFRDAWRHSNGVVNIDMESARNIWRNKIRAARKPLLSKLDVDYMRADERGDTSAKDLIAKNKQELRDAPQDPAIDAAQTPEDLMAVWPRALSLKF